MFAHFNYHTMDASRTKQIEIWEKQYSPSQWSKRFPTASECIDYHLKFVRDLSDENRKEFQCNLNVAYGDMEREKFDIYGHDLPEDAPLFVYIHGGFWQMLNKEESAYCVKPLVERGFRVIILDYELCPDVALEQIVVQIKRAGEHILNYAAVNRVKHVCFAGHSAGAHLIATMLDRDFVATVGSKIQLIKHLYLISGVYGLDELRFTQAVNADNLLGLDDATTISLSPMQMSYQHLSNLGIKFHIYVAEHDSSVFKQMSIDLNKHLDRYGITSDLHILPGLDHFDIVEKLSEKNFVITSQILENV
ncbi:kynurenine formamidase [Topomyia yanbarensis]|uniref:kynurenine formamidase n=1 Tax=Topomyia yanbarensis TaxID=2498891 RepID=UPI00273BA64D|nr:kynurenine formamidase [Topomyia yanbarensis]XP_058815892.1 kynurenine formamidase [Topomyia yanbarensis]